MYAISCTKLVHEMHKYRFVNSTADLHRAATLGSNRFA